VTPISSTSAASGSPPASDPKLAQLRAAAEAFEAVFLRQVIGSMRQAKLGEDLFGSEATDQFRNMADSRLADSMAGQGSFGIAELLLKQFGAAARLGAPEAPASSASQAAEPQQARTR
jgi:flagellar protein FlgJ